MEQGCDALKWSPRLPKEKLRRLYLTEAKGIYDNKLIDDVGMSLYMRCRDILTVKMAREEKKVRCPVCDDAQKETLIPRSGGRREIIKCPVCGWKIVWEDYLKTVKRKQLNAGGAVKAFETFMRNYENANSPKEKMLSIDRLLHEFHYSVKEQPDQPTRPVGVNLITGNLKSVIEFLDKLTAGEFCAPELKETKDQWDKNLHGFENINWKSIVDKKRKKKDS
ncbi:MAG: hypothetical protein APR63_05285 [Desulfuromonas sp. SDB]|nr:MAG: hypothetical protein APR63_05285 [Desulfuromonas sp. SDB]